MPVEYEVRPGVLIVRQSGETQTNEIYRMMGRALADPQLAEGSVLLWDGREATTVRTNQEIRDSLVRFVATAERLGPKIAILATRDVNYGMGRMFATYASSQIDVRIFGEESAALAWLCESG